MKYWQDSFTGMPDFVEGGTATKFFPALKYFHDFPSTICQCFSWLKQLPFLLKHLLESGTQFSRSIGFGQKQGAGMLQPLRCDHVAAC